MLGTILRVTLSSAIAYAYGAEVAREIKKPANERDKLNIVVCGCISGLAGLGAIALITSK